MAIDNYTPEQIEEILQAFFEVAGTRQYIGARYVPIFGRGRGTPIEWDNSDAYEPLSIVYYQGDTYTSRRYVPAGIAINNQDYWVITGRYNAQVEQYRQEVLAFQGQIDGIRTDLESDYVPFPDSDHYPKYGTLGQVLTTLADGETKWENPVVPSDAQAEEIITQWLSDHPEATTTVQDGAITNVKIHDDTIKNAKLIQKGGVLNDVITLGSSFLKGNMSTSALWESGLIDATTGANTTVATRMRTIDFISPSISTIKTTSGLVMIYGYDKDGTYLGQFDPATNTFTIGSIFTTNDADLHTVKTAHPDYKFRVVWYLSGHNPVPATDYSNVVFLNDYSMLPSELSTLSASIPELITRNNLSVASLWESGVINITTGANNVNASRMRTIGYILDTITSIKTLTGYVMIYGYDSSGTYLGQFDPATNTFTIGSIFTTNDADLHTVKTAHPDYKFRVVWYLSNHTPVPATDYSNVVFLNDIGINAYNIDNIIPAINNSRALYDKKIVNMGDSIFGMFHAPNDVSTFLSTFTGADCYNCAFGGTRAVYRGATGYGPFDLTQLIDAIIAQDFTEQDACAIEYPTFAQCLATLKTVDFSEIDMVTIAYGTNDYNGNVVIGTDNSDKTTYRGALRYAISQLNANFPNLRVTLVTPLFREMTSLTPSEPADTHQNTNGDTLTDFVEAMETTAAQVHSNCINNYYMGINSTNYTSHYIDGVHPNEETRRALANHIAQNLF